MRGIAPAGFVLVGGRSLRMGENKALLSYRGRALAQHMVELLSGIAEPVSLVGDPGVYGHLGYRAILDAAPDRGPLSGIEAALHSSVAAEWNFILACDLPAIEPAFLGTLRSHAEQAAPEVDCLVPETQEKEMKGKLQPLCALYRRRCGPLATKALGNGTRRVVDFVAMLQADICPVEQTAQFRNVNTRSEWNRFLAAPPP